MSRSVLPEHARNGGFPEPPADEIVRVVAARHDACGSSVRVRLPGSVPIRAVRRLHCASCAEAFEALRVDEIGLELSELRAAVPEPSPKPELSANELEAALPPRRFERPAVERPKPKPAPPKPETAKPKVAKPKVAKAPKPKRAMPKLALPKLSTPKLSKPKLSTPKLPALKLGKFDPESRSWRLLSIVIAGALVIGGLLVLRGGSDQPSISPASGAAATGNSHHPRGGGASSSDPKVLTQASKDATLVDESSYSLALPPGWQRIEPPSGATFAAVSADDDADATLWITQDPKLDFPTFLAQSEAQLEALAGAPPKVEQSPASSPEDTVYTLTAPAPPGQPTYQVTLRTAASYSYYFATTLQPDASRDAIQGLDLITGSLTPALGQ